MTKLSVNINKVATLRNARGGNVPDVLAVALDCERFGADGITVHPRPDERHIRYDDVISLKPLLTTEFNIEGYPEKKFTDLVTLVRPAQVTLVPDPPGVLTSNAGWKIRENFEFLRDVITGFRELGIRTSLFMETDPENIELAAETGCDRIELYTEDFARMYPSGPGEAVKPYVAAAVRARSLGLGVNAGHDLSLQNLAYLKESIPFLEEVSIGHALISDALYFGLENTIPMYKNCLREKE